MHKNLILSLNVTILKILAYLSITTIIQRNIIILTRSFSQNMVKNILYIISTNPISKVKRKCVSGVVVQCNSRTNRLPALALLSFFTIDG